MRRFLAAALVLALSSADAAGGQGTGARRLRIIATSDFHGALEARPDTTGRMRGGAAALASTIASARRDCRPPDCHALVLDGGDLFQGTPASNLSFGAPVLEAYGVIGYSAVAVGNHEFDWGTDTLRALMRRARFPFLGANIRYTDGRDVEWIPDDTLIRIGETSVGLVGVTTRQTPLTTMALNVEGLRFDEPAPIVDSLARALRARGAQAVIVVAHAGGRCAPSGDCQGELVELAATVRERIDAFVGGHSHSRLAITIGGAPVMVAGSRGQGLAVIDLALDGSAPATYRLVEVLPDSASPSPEVEAIVERALSRVAALVSRPVATMATPLPVGSGQFPLGHLVADAMRVVGRGDLAIVNTGGIRAGLRAGVATFGDVFEVQPFGNILYRVRVRGGDLRAYFARTLGRPTSTFHLSGARIVFHGGASGVVIDTLEVGGGPLVDDIVYTVIINDFMLTGGDGLGFGPVGRNPEPAHVLDQEALDAYLRSLPQPVRAPTEPRIIRGGSQ